MANFFSGKDHQKEDWKSHKKNCIKAYTVRDDPVAGRVMVANRLLITRGGRGSWAVNYLLLVF